MPVCSETFVKSLVSSRAASEGEETIFTTVSAECLSPQHVFSSSGSVRSAQVTLGLVTLALLWS